VPAGDLMLEQSRVRIHDANTGYLPADWQWYNRPTEHWQGWLLWLVLDGQGRMVTETESYDLARGDCLILPMSGEGAARHDPANPMLIPWCRFDLAGSGAGTESGPRDPGTPGAGTPASGPLGLGPHRRLANVAFLARLLDRCVQAFARQERERAEYWLQGGLLEIAEQGQRGAAVSWTRAEQESMVEEICELIRQTPAKWYRARELAAYMYLSPDHFTRVFRQVTGTTPGEFMIRTRMEAARNLLRFSDRPVGEVAEALGYRDVYFFSKQFRQRTGESPTGYRRGGWAAAGRHPTPSGATRQKWR